MKKKLFLNENFQLVQEVNNSLEDGVDCEFYYLVANKKLFRLVTDYKQFNRIEKLKSDRWSQLSQYELGEFCFGCPVFEEFNEAKEYLVTLLKSEIRQNQEALVFIDWIQVCENITK